MHILSVLVFQSSQFLTEIFLDYAVIKQYLRDSSHQRYMNTLPCEAEQQTYD